MVAVGAALGGTLGVGDMVGTGEAVSVGVEVGGDEVGVYVCGVLWGKTVGECMGKFVGVGTTAGVLLQEPNKIVKTNK